MTTAAIVNAGTMIFGLCILALTIIVAKEADRRQKEKEAIAAMRRKPYDWRKQGL